MVVRSLYTNAIRSIMHNTRMCMGSTMHQAHSRSRVALLDADFARLSGKHHVDVANGSDAPVRSDQVCD